MPLLLRIPGYGFRGNIAVACPRPWAGEEAEGRVEWEMAFSAAFHAGIRLDGERFDPATRDRGF